MSWQVFHNPKRSGIYKNDCERCGRRGDCRLTMVVDRYLWACADGCRCSLCDTPVAFQNGVMIHPDGTGHEVIP